MSTFLGHTEIFWVGLQAVTAILALLGLLLYTFYTRTMMKTQEDMRKASLSPSLVGRYFRGGNNTDQTVEECFEVTNVGAGAATNLMYWNQNVKRGFMLLDGVEKRFAGHSAVIAGHLLPAKSTTITFDSIWRGEATLFIIQAEDALGGTHQLKYYREGGPNGFLQSRICKADKKTLGIEDRKFVTKMKSLFKKSKVSPNHQ